MASLITHVYAALIKWRRATPGGGEREVCSHLSALYEIAVKQVSQENFTLCILNIIKIQK